MLLKRVSFSFSGLFYLAGLVVLTGFIVLRQKVLSGEAAPTSAAAGAG